MSAAALHAALATWGLSGAAVTLVARRENTVYRVDQGGARYALRLHCPGYRTGAELVSELDWMRHLGARGLPVPTPLPARDGALLCKAGGHHASLLTWLAGRPLGATGMPLDLPDREGMFRAMGGLMARLHAVSDDWTPPPGFTRPRWDADGLLGEAPLWGRFWDNPGLTAPERALVHAARTRLRADLAATPTDTGLIHADMLRENVLVDGAAPGLIDFDDSGHGFRLFDVATALFKNRDEPDYPALEAAFLDGYRSQRPLDTGALQPMLTIRALSYLGWIIPRMDEPGAAARQARFVGAALPMVRAYLAAP